ncbi:MAG: cupin domain-containing protein [Acidobacteriota bacterium]|nr:cupin domain-containing protein [Acidobacteriota bacterium]
MQKTNQRIDILGAELKWLLPLEATGNKYCLLEARIAPGVGVPPHQHPDQESFYVLEGDPEFALEINGRLKWQSAVPGQLVNVPPNAIHGFRNTSYDEVRVLITGTEGLGRFFEEAGLVLAEGESACAEPSPDTIQQVISIAEKHGQRFLGPA